MGIASGVFLWLPGPGWQVLFNLCLIRTEWLHLLPYQRPDAAGKLQSSAVLHQAAEQLYCQVQHWQQPETTAIQNEQSQLAVRSVWRGKL